jgi:hypothetical protein
MRNNLFGKIDEFFDWWVLLRPEKKKIVKNIKKFCKKYYIRKEFLEMYLKIQLKILIKVNKLSKENKPLKSFEKDFCVSLIKSRLFELSLEFSEAVRQEYFHSANALTRQMIEIYFITSYLILDESYCNTLIGEEGSKKFPRFKEIINRLRKSDVWPNIKNFQKEKFFDGVESDYGEYSGYFHPKQDSFMQNIWVVDKDEKGNFVNTRPYKNKGNGKDPTILLFPKKTPWSPDYIKRLIHVFYTYTGFGVDMVNKLEGENED